MAPTREKFYFLAPTTETPVEGPMFLGGIITHPRDADAPLNSRPLAIDQVAMPIYRDEIPDYTVTLERSKTGTFGVFCAFLAQVLGIGLDAEEERARSNSETWNCEMLKTIWFNPTAAYIKDSLDNSEVKDFLVDNPNWLGQSKVYMITGLKLAYGASGVMTYAKSKGFNMQLGFDATSLGIPIEAGPKGGYTIEDKVEQNMGQKTPFVLAFRIRRIRITQSGKVNSQPVTGGMLGLEGDKSDGEASQPSFLVDGLEDVDANAEEFEVDTIPGVSDLTSSAVEPCGCSRVSNL